MLGLANLAPGQPVHAGQWEPAPGPASRTGIGVEGVPGRGAAVVIELSDRRWMVPSGTTEGAYWLVRCERRPGFLGVPAVCRYACSCPRGRQISRLCLKKAVCPHAGAVARMREEVA